MSRAPIQCGCCYRFRKRSELRTPETAELFYLRFFFGESQKCVHCLRERQLSWENAEDHK